MMTELYFVNTPRNFTKSSCVIIRCIQLDFRPDYRVHVTMFFHHCEKQGAYGGIVNVPAVNIYR